MTPTEILSRVLLPAVPSPELAYDIEAEPAWFPKGQQASEPSQAGEAGEAQAIIAIDGKAYCISLEELP